MVFSSLNFIFIFLPLVLFFYFIVPKRFRTLKNIILLIFSLIFYAYGEPKGIFVMIASIVGNYVFAYAIEVAKKKTSKKAALVLSVVYNLGILCYYKYTGFIFENISRIFDISTSIPEIIMPIGISFFTFQGMSYVFDVYKGTSRAQKNIINVATYVSLFPQLVAGPIVRYETIEKELVDRNETLERAAHGIRRFIVGLAKKMIIANTLGAVATEIFAMDVSTLSAGVAWVGAIAYTFQIFFDFSAYSDMAIGLGHVFGFTFLENFNYPYISRSITEFWRRWHMSLSTWFRDYVYIPLGGNRKGLPRQIFNIFVVWLLTGLWHGAAWNFVVWGLYFAIFLVIEKLFLGKALKKVWRPISHIYSLLIIIGGWVIFNSASLADAGGYFMAMIGQATAPSNADYAIYLLSQYKVEFIVAALLSLPLVKTLCERGKNNKALVFIANIALIALFLISVMYIINTSFNPFIYFRF